MRIIDYLLLALSQGFEFFGVLFQLPSIILLDISRFLYSASGFYPVEENNDEENDSNI